MSCLIRDRLLVFFELIDVGIFLQLRAPLLKILLQFVVHPIVLEVGVGILDPHHVFLEERLPILYLSDAHLALR